MAQHLRSLLGSTVLLPTHSPCKQGMSTQQTASNLWSLYSSWGRRAHKRQSWGSDSRGGSHTGVSQYQGEGRGFLVGEALFQKRVRKSETDLWSGLPHGHFPRPSSRRRIPSQECLPCAWLAGPVRALSLCANPCWKPVSHQLPKVPSGPPAPRACTQLALGPVLGFGLSTLSLHSNPGSLGSTLGQAGLTELSAWNYGSHSSWVSPEQIPAALTKKMWKPHLRMENS